MSLSENISPTVILISRKKMLVLLILAALFIGVGVLFFFLALTRQSDETILLGIIGTVIVIFFSLAARITWEKYREERPGLVLDERGITDHTTAHSIGHIPWADIKDIELYHVLGSEFLIIQVHRPRAYIAKATTTGQRQLLQSNYNMYGSPLSLSANSLERSLDEVAELLETHWKAYRSTQPDQPDEAG